MLLIEMSQEISHPVISRILKKLLRLRIHTDIPVIYKQDSGRHIPCKCHLVSDNNHGHALSGKLTNQVKLLLFQKVLPF